MKTLVLLLTAAFAVLPACAITFAVTTNSDAGTGSLRQAILDANANPGDDTITFVHALSGQKILLTSGQLSVNDSVTILGPGANQLSIDGNGNSRVFYLSPGLTNLIAGVTITNGYGIFAGGGIFVDHGFLTVSNVALTGNYAILDGGGTFNYGATITLQNCTLSGNSAGSYGGGIFNTVVDREVRALLYGIRAGNSTDSSDVGMDGDGSATATLTLQNCTLSGNSARSGGGIYNYSEQDGSATLTLWNSTFNGNSAKPGPGGGIYNIYESGVGGSATLIITHTLFAKGASGANYFDSSGSITNLGYNLSDDDSTTNFFASNVGDLKLGPLTNNGGSTLTHAPLPGSPAINAGNPSFVPPPFYDQRGRGFPRISEGRIDIGALELQAGPFPAVLVNPVWFAADGRFGFTFENVSGANFNVMAATNLALPLSNWTVLSNAIEISPGQYQFTDTQAADVTHRFYRVSSQ